TNRYNYLSNNVEVAQQGPIILGMDQYDSSGRWNVAPLPGQVVRIRVRLANAAQTASVRLNYAEGWVGNFQRMPMWDDGLHFDSLPGDGLYGAELPGLAAMTVVRYYAEAVANNTTQSLTFFPAGAEHDVMVYRVQGGALRNGLVINEFMAMNQGGPVDDNGENDDWIELHNVSNQAVNAGRYVLTDNPLNTTKWKFPRNTVVPAGGYLIVWADEDSSQGPYHANFKLSGLGETLYLYDSNTVLQDEVIYPNQVLDSSWARIPNGSGPFMRRAHTIAANNNFALTVPNNVWTRLDFRLFPNPGDKQIHWEISGMHENIGSGQGSDVGDPSFEAELVNAAGQVLWKSSGALVQQPDAPNPGGVVDVSDWPQGVYWFRMRSGNRVYLRTWIKR
ncbi:MAG: lamin tail domain-containing protein, partial [Bacteroidota bacterium]